MLLKRNSFLLTRVMRGSYPKTPISPNATKYFSELHAQKIESAFFKLDPINQFKEKYKYCELTTYVADCLTTWKKLMAMDANNPKCFATLMQTPVTTALGVASQYFAPPEKITIEELEALDSDTLDKIIDCRSSLEVINIVREWQENNPGSITPDEDKS